MGRETAGLSELSETLGKAVSVQEIPTVVFTMTNDRRLIRFSAVLAFYRAALFPLFKINRLWSIKYNKKVLLKKSCY